MSGNLQTTIEYVFKVVDQASGPLGQMSQTMDTVNEKTVSLNRAQDEVIGKASDVSETVSRARTEVETDIGRVHTSAQEAVSAAQQAGSEISAEAAQMRAEMDSVKVKADQLDTVAQLTAFMGFREAVSAVTGGIIGLGLVSDETAQDLQKINAAFSLFSGAVTAIKAVQAVMTTLNATSAIGAVINTYNKVIENPAALAGVGIAIGSAAGVAGALLMSSSSTTNNSTTINISGGTPKPAQSEIYRLVEGGAL